jgi:hypothetical protein
MTAMDRSIDAADFICSPLSFSTLFHTNQMFFSFDPIRSTIRTMLLELLPIKEAKMGMEIS